MCIPFVIKLVDILDEIDRRCMLRENEEKKSYRDRKKETKIESCLDNYNNTNHSYVHMNYD